MLCLNSKQTNKQIPTLLLNSFAKYSTPLATVILPFLDHDGSQGCWIWQKKGW